MSQKFLMLFLTSEVSLSARKPNYHLIMFNLIKDGLVTIHFAARVLLGDTKSDITEHGKFKSI